MKRLAAYLGICFIILCKLRNATSLSREIENEDLKSISTKELQIFMTANSLLTQMISSLKKEVTQMSDFMKNQIPLDCSGALKRGDWRKISQIKPPFLPPRTVRCDQFTDGGGWTVIVHRASQHLFFLEDKKKKTYDSPKELPQDVIRFNRTWSEYKTGFGNPEEEYWIGNEVLHQLTQEHPWEAAVMLEDWNGTEGRALWKAFRVLGEDTNYKLEISGYDKAKSNIGDGLTYHSGCPFSTTDVDNDEYEAIHCAKRYGGGWWFRHCHVSYLTGTHLLPGKEGQHALHWLPWRNSISLKSASMMIRPSKLSW